MNSNVIVALISFLGTFIGTLGGIITSGKLTNYRIEQLEKKVDSQNRFTALVPIIEEKLKGFERRISNLEIGGLNYDGIKINDYKDNYAFTRNSQSDS